MRDILRTYMPAVTRGRGPLDFARIVVFELTQGSRFGQRFVATTCEVGRATARRLGLPDSVQRGLYEVNESWNGKGGPQGLRGEAISIAGRVAQLGFTAAHFTAIGGAELATAVVRQRAGSSLDPAIATGFTEAASTILAAADVDDPKATVLDAEPAPVRTVEPARLTEVAAVIGDIADLKSPFMLGHAAGVAALATAAAERLRLDASEIERLHVAALLHDVGRVGISDGTWERPGPLTATQWEQVRLHTYHSERILARSTALEPMAKIAGMHHERIDGSGYHRGSVSREIPMGARILGAADAFQAMTQARAHRGALSENAAADTIHDEVRAGRLDPDAAAAVLDAAGRAWTRGRRTTPAGLSDREIEVLRAMARGSTNRDIARRFAISPRTAEHHVQHIYTKIGVSSRAAAALFAMEHDLLD
jgi:HD-GYP domain-containing protein (c-di-GMP phosphodiesterase class II)/DNA-binding CsgD family transcriptional regulator